MSTNSRIFSFGLSIPWIFGNGIDGVLDVFFVSIEGSALVLCKGLSFFDVEFVNIFRAKIKKDIALKIVLLLDLMTEENLAVENELNSRKNER